MGKETENKTQVVTEPEGARSQEPVIDPAKVTRSALQNAASIAALMLTTEALVTDKPEEEEEKAPTPPMPQY